MKLGFKEKAAYGIGAVGKDMVYMLSATYILYYYQDIMGVSAWAMGIILLIARVFDAFNDPLMGIVVAKTKTKWGKFRPWLFIGTLTNAVVLAAMFAAPPALNGKGLVAYAAITYILWGITYTMMDIPYWSMVPAFTESGKERETMSALGRTCAGVGSAIITVVTMIVVVMLGNFILGKSPNVQTSDFEEVEVYVLELNELGETTGEYKILSAPGKITVSADKNEWKNVMTFVANSEKTNVKYEITLGDTVFGTDQENTLSLDFAADDPSNGKAVMSLYVSSDVYKQINESTLVTGSIDSSKNVERLGFKFFTIIVAILFFVFTLITCIFIKEKSTVDVKTAKISDMFKALLQNDQAMAIVITIVLVNCAIYITSNLIIYFFKYDLGGSDWQVNYTYFNMFGGGMQILSMCVIFPILRKFFNTRRIFYICVNSAVFGYFVLLGFAIAGMRNAFAFFIPAFFIFAAVGVINVLVTIFLANTVDYGEIKNNRRDESVIFSMQTFVVKLASGIAAMVAALALSAFSISNSGSYEAVDGSMMEGLRQYIMTLAEQGSTSLSDMSIMGLRLVMTALPVAFLFFGTLRFRRGYKLTDEKLAEINEQIKEKRLAEQA
jgi:Na+/melibiose symporter-like transporter